MQNPKGGIAGLLGDIFKRNGLICVKCPELIHELVTRGCQRWTSRCGWWIDKVSTFPCRHRCVGKNGRCLATPALHTSLVKWFPVPSLRCPRITPWNVSRQYDVVVRGSTMRIVAWTGAELITTTNPIDDAHSVATSSKVCFFSYSPRKLGAPGEVTQIASIKNPSAA